MLPHVFDKQGCLATFSETLLQLEQIHIQSCMFEPESEEEPDAHPEEAECYISHYYTLIAATFWKIA